MGQMKSVYELQGKVWELQQARKSEEHQLVEAYRASIYPDLEARWRNQIIEAEELYNAALKREREEMLDKGLKECPLPEGTRVVEYERDMGHWILKFKGWKRGKTGVVEVARGGKHFGRGKSYSVGTPIVRYLKKDGTEGVQTEDLINHWSPSRFWLESDPAPTREDDKPKWYTDWQATQDRVVIDLDDDEEAEDEAADSR